MQKYGQCDKVLKYYGVRSMNFLTTFANKQHNKTENVQM